MSRIRRAFDEGRLSWGGLFAVATLVLLGLFTNWFNWCGLVVN